MIVILIDLRDLLLLLISHCHNSGQKYLPVSTGNRFSFEDVLFFWFVKLNGAVVIAGRLLCGSFVEIAGKVEVERTFRNGFVILQLHKISVAVKITVEQ